MDNSGSVKGNQLASFILGSIAGGIIALLFAPCSGEELRQKINLNAKDIIKQAKKKEEELINKAKNTADDLITRAIRLTALADKYSNGMFDIPAEKMELEIKSLRAAVDAAVKTYTGKVGTNGEPSFGMTEDANKTGTFENIFSDYDNVVLPKQEGMKKRFNLRYR